LQLPLQLPESCEFALTGAPTLAKYTCRTPFTPVPSELLSAVAGETKKYTLFSPLVFDDSYVHSVSSSSSSSSSNTTTTNCDRVVLIVDLWHPSLQPSHIHLLRRHFPATTAPSSPLPDLSIPPQLPPADAGDMPEQSEPSYILLKMLIVGACGVGKSAFVLRYMRILV
jgi:hypothetical protein